jgi:hypothetical protein
MEMSPGEWWLIYGLFCGNKKKFPATKEPYRVYIGTRN